MSAIRGGRWISVYLVPVDVWYIIPFDVVEGNLSLNLTPRKGHKFAQYMEGWNLLRGAEKKARVFKVKIPTLISRRARN
jgi:hypothetical protein